MTKEPLQPGHSSLNATRETLKALLVSTYQGSMQRATCEEHLEELELLAKTYGVEAVGRVPCAIRKFDAALYVGKGKLEELIKMAGEQQADLVIFDDEITPAQQRNLEKAFQRPVLDRTAVILAVFAQRARTKEARLQIELAQVKYEVPRLKRLWSHLSRQQGTSGAGGGGGAYLKGEGEKQIEIDRRLLKRKIDQLHKEIAEVRAHRETQKISRNRSEVPVFAIVGYTNAGKSTLLNALTQAGVFVEDKLFATLDTTTRKFTLKNNQSILLVDTVGFIRKLPHLLVAAFKSTLEEALQADVLLHLIDASHPMAEEQAAATYEVLRELGAGSQPILTVMNKMDRASDGALIQRLRMSYPKNVQISALTGEGLTQLEEAIIQELTQRRQLITVRIPQREYALVSEIRRFGDVRDQTYEDDDILLRVEVPAPLAGKLAPYRLP